MKLSSEPRRGALKPGQTSTMVANEAEFGADTERQGRDPRQTGGLAVGLVRVLSVMAGTCSGLEIWPLTESLKKVAVEAALW
jgi:hypothetical protein